MSHFQEKISKRLEEFYDSYLKAGLENGYHEKELKKNFELFSSLVQDEIKGPFSFDLYHKALRRPFDYYQFGLDFLRPIVMENKSSLQGKETLQEVEKNLKKSHNAIFFANHQTEPDPQFLSLLLQSDFPKIAEGLIFVAGHRVLEDPLAIPFSKGRNILSIYSKRHSENPPEKRAEKLMHNKKTLIKLRELLDQGGAAIYVAPSGGRDRAGNDGNVHPSALDQESLQLFYLLGKTSLKKSHFYPLALATYHAFPPPEKIEKELGERRLACLSPIHAYFGKELDLDFPSMTKQEAKQFRTCFVEQKIEILYKHIQ